jgi:SAM-dependent methyltransferase
MARVLKPGGIAVVIDNVVPEDPVAAEFINRFETIRDPSHNRAYGEREWIEFYRAAGLEILALERFRKARDFDVWTSMMSVSDATKAELRKMLLEAPSAAREALAPEEADGALRFYLDEILISGSRPRD